jgi:hypothetical protein
MSGLIQVICNLLNISQIEKFDLKKKLSKKIQANL